MIFNFENTSSHNFKQLLAGFSFLFMAIMIPSAWADSSQSSATVTVSITVPGIRQPAQPFAARGLPGKGWIGGATLNATSFPQSDIQLVTIHPIVDPAGPGSVATDRLWVRVSESGADFVPLTQIAGRTLANPNATMGSQLPEIEFRPTWQDAPGKYLACLQITPGSAENSSPGEPSFCELEAEVPPFLDFEIENSLVRFVPSSTSGEMRGTQDIQIRVTTNSDRWKIKLSCSKKSQTCPVRFELMNYSQNTSGPVSGYSSKSGAVTGRAAAQGHLLVFRPVCKVEEFEGETIQVLVDGYTEN